MSDAMSFTEIDDHAVELLPARTLLSMTSAGGVNTPTPGQISDAAGGNHPMYDAWMNALTLLGVPHVSQAEAADNANMANQ
jgi:hypothetical protein